MCSAAALATGSVDVAMPTAAPCEVGYNSTSLLFSGCAAEEQACEGRGYIYGTIAFAQCVVALGGQVIQVPERRALRVRPATPPPGPQQTQAPSPPLAPPRPLLAPPLPLLAPPLASPPNRWP